MIARQSLPVEPSDDFLPDLQRRLLASRARRAPLRGSRVAAGLAAATVLVVAAASLQLMDAPAGGSFAGVGAGSTSGTSDAATTQVSRAETVHGVFGIEPPEPRVVRLVSNVRFATGQERAGWVARQVAREVATATRATYSPGVAAPGYRVRRPAATFTLNTDSRALD